MEIEYVTDRENSAMKSLFPELLGTRRQMNLFPITERHLKGARSGSDADEDQGVAAE